MTPKEKAEYLNSVFEYNVSINIIKEELQRLPMIEGELNPEWEYFNEVRKELEKFKV